MDAACRCNNNVTGTDGSRRALRIQQVLTLSGQNGPGILAVGMDVCGNALPREHAPRNHHRLGGLGYHRTDGLAVRGLKELSALEDAFGIHLGHPISKMPIARKKRTTLT
jgi:hypothetical protein